jgi:hypothetical protein
MSNSKAIAEIAEAAERTIAAVSDEQALRGLAGDVSGA